MSIYNVKCPIKKMETIIITNSIHTNNIISLVKKLTILLLLHEIFSDMKIKRFKL